MSVKNLKTGKVQIIAATALTLFFSVAQSDPGSASRYGANNLHPINQETEWEFGDDFIGADEREADAVPRARLALSTTGEQGDVSVIEMRSADSTRLHFNIFDGNETGNALSATLRIKGRLNVIEGEETVGTIYTETDETVDSTYNATDYSLSFNSPSGQVVLENNVVSFLNASGFSQIDLSDRGVNDRMTEHFLPELGKVMFGVGLSRFSFVLEESLAGSYLGFEKSLDGQPNKGDMSHTNGGWACAGALISLVAANAALAAAIAATYATLGAMSAGIAAAVSLVGAAIAFVDMNCMQM